MKGKNDEARVLRVVLKTEQVSVIMRALRSSNRSNKEVTEVNSGLKSRRVGTVVITGSAKTKRRSEHGNIKTTSRTVTMDKRYESKLQPSCAIQELFHTRDRAGP